MGSNPTPATTLNNPTRGSTDSQPEDCSSPAPGAPSGLPSSPISFADAVMGEMGGAPFPDALRLARSVRRPVRDPLTDPRRGDRVRLASSAVATVLGVTLGEQGSVDYRYADRDGGHYAVAALSAWRSLCIGGKALEPEVLIGEAFDAIEVVR